MAQVLMDLSRQELKVIGEKVMKNLVLAYFRDEEGQTSTEYILLVAVVALIVFKFKKTAETQLGQITEGVFGGAQNWVDQINSGQ